MSGTSRPRVSAAEAGLFVLLGLLGWATWHTYRVVEEVNRAPIVLSRIEREHRDIADHVQLFVDDTHRALAQVVTATDRDAWEKFQRRSRAFDAWIEERRQLLTQSRIIMVWPIGLTVDFESLLTDLKSAAADYGREAAPLAESGLPVQKALEIEEQSAVKSDRLEQLGLRARAQADGIHLFLEGSRRWLWWLRRLMLASLLTLGAASLWLALVVYRRVITPLQARLIESEAIIERQQKLAHFGELAAIVAHEIRNPLTAISTRLYTLQRTLTRGTREDTDATVIRDEINRLDRIVTEFLESAQPSAPVLAPMKVGELFERVHRLLAPTCEKKNIDLKIEETTEASFLGDLHQLTQVLINLIQNAEESIGHAGAIRLRARQEQRRLHDRPIAVVLLEVEDTGPGIPVEVQTRLFDPFFSTKKEGTGLGLSIAARIIARHGGAIDFRSEPGSTVFTIALPVHEVNS